MGTVQAMHLRIEHIESDNGPVPYWHVQRLLFTQATFTAARGFTQNLGAEVVVPVRLVRDWIRYEDLARNPFVPVPPDVHHRNETLTGVSDARIMAHYGGAQGAWTYGLRAGLSVPLGGTVQNPFELGRLGLPHEHIQFGTGTWDPILYAGLARPIGHGQIEVAGLARFPLYANGHGYQAGDQFSADLTYSRRVTGLWGGFAGLTFAREEAEHWSGRLEEEGNLGRRDLSLALGAGHPVAGLGTASFSVAAPLHSEAEGEQSKGPWIFSLTWTH